MATAFGAQEQAQKQAKTGQISHVWDVNQINANRFGMYLQVTEPGSHKYEAHCEDSDNYWSNTGHNYDVGGV